MHITDAADGSDRVVPHVRHVPWEASYDGAFSADGRYLALPIKAGRAERVVLVDVRADTSRLIGGPRLATIYPLFGWAPGNTLYYVTGGALWLVTWSAGAERRRFRAASQGTSRTSRSWDRTAGYTPSAAVVAATCRA